MLVIPHHSVSWN